MARRLLHLIALLLVVLWGPARGALLAAAPPALCCCGEPEGAGTGPCGMPTCPPRCPPQAPCSGGALSLQAPAAQVAGARSAQARRTLRGKEPSPWPARSQASRARPVALAAAPTHGPPPKPLGDPQARLGTFRI